VHSSLLGGLAQERINDRRREATAERAVAQARSSTTPRSPWRIVLGVRLIGWGCRLWLSGHQATGRERGRPSDHFDPQFARRAG
jgi:hypothetical protein